ncbi:MAG: right-handed parallel beta-helix repeat-containing protein [Thalassotalea sp.]
MNMHFKKSLLALSLIALIPTAIAADIYVSKTGNDDADGSLATPYLSINKAAQIAVAGDTVFIREGTYNETLKPSNSGAENSPITFQSYENEKVIITAMETVNGWQLDQANIYVADITNSLGQLNFIMQASTAMDLARWPNNTVGDPYAQNTQNTLRNTGGSGADVINAYLDYSSGIPAGDWSKGGSVHFYGDKPGSGWTTWRSFITSNTSTRVSFSLDKNPSWIRTFHAPVDKGDFFLQGIKEAIDYQNEWYLNEDANKLYVQLPDGVAPAQDQIQMRKRITTINLNSRNYIHIKNLAVFGGSIEITNGASNNHIYGITSLYGNNTLGVVSGFAANSQSINIRGGSNNIIEKSEIGFGSGTGIYDSGNHTQIINSYIHDFNYLGNYDAIINARGGNNTKLLNNVITRAGRDAIQGFNRNAEYAYNDISYSNLIADDCGLFYTVGGPHNSVIHHNWFHDAYSSGTKKKATAIYLDNDAEGYDVHHNVIWNTEWSNIQINWSGKDLNIYNNTLWNGSTTMGAWHKDGTAFSNVNVWNNISDKNSWEPQSDKQNNLTLASTTFADFSNQDFRLAQNSDAIDQGKIIPDITSDVVDGKPDVGAYERGGDNANWVAGIDWERKLGPTGNGCYGLPGEDCITVPTEVPTVTFSQNITLDEGQSTTVIATLSSNAMLYPVAIPYTISGTATNDDHDAMAGTLTINSGTEKSIVIAISSDDLVEADETLILTMGTPTNANLGNNEAVTITIKDKTPAPEPEPTPTPTPEAPSTEQSGGSGGTSYWLVLLSIVGIITRRIVK